jgi:hypothetical protein
MSRDEIYRIAGAAGVDWRTVKSVLAGKGSRASQTVVRAAAKELGIKLPLPKTAKAKAA